MVRVGAEVTFEVRGYPGQAFTGKVERISPTADPTTRQVPIWVTVDDRTGRLVAGLFAAKLAWEHFQGAVPFTAGTLSLPVVHEAHSYGAIGGVLAAFWLGRKRRSSRSSL